MKLKKWQKPPQPMTKGDGVFMRWLMDGIKERHARAIQSKGLTDKKQTQTTIEGEKP